MVKNPKKEDRPKESEFKKFVKKRAPIYLAVVALVVVFVVPELTKNDLKSLFPEDLTAEEMHVLNALMGYRGPDGEGLSLIEAVSEKISEEYPNENVFDSKRTSVDIQISNTDAEQYQVLLSFESHKGKQDYSWNVDLGTGEVDGNDSRAKHVVDLVDFYD